MPDSTPRAMPPLATSVGVHTCHADCPCHTGGQPVTDFIERPPALQSEQIFTRTLRLLDERERGLGGVTLTETDLSPAERADEVCARLRAATIDLTNIDLGLIEQAGAHLVALHTVILDAKTVRPEVSDETETRAA